MHSATVGWVLHGGGSVFGMGIPVSVGIIHSPVGPREAGREARHSHPIPLWTQPGSGGWWGSPTVLQSHYSEVLRSLS